jgi:hypothetical protein
MIQAATHAQTTFKQHSLSVPCQEIGELMGLCGGQLGRCVLQGCPKVSLSIGDYTPGGVIRLPCSGV